MLKLEDLKPGLALVGLEPSVVATIAAIVPISDDSFQVIYKTPDGTLKDRLLGRADEENISIAVAERPWSFDGDGDAFKLAVGAKRIDLAFLFDPMMAVHTSNVEPLPHQITAVYESMLPRQPLRFVLADDPGAGKTIMAGLYIRELVMRADAQRICIVAPGSLVEQWRDEMWEKFGLQFRVFSKELELASPSGNPFDDHDRLILRLDQMSRNEELRDKLCAAPWDLAIFDEAHKCAAHYYGNKLERTKRFILAEKLGEQARHLLLMTATPHNGKEEDYQLFLSLLDSDRFYGKFRDGVHKVDASDVMRRMVKEEMVRFDGTPLFPERRANTVNYKLSDAEAALYEAVTEYVKTEMGKAEALGGQRKGSVGFALTALQRRLASSPEAIFQSLKRRHHRKAEARRLQPYFVRSFFTEAFDKLGGSMHPRETGRFEITHVPASLRERDRRITGRNQRDSSPVLRRYERVCFTKEAVRLLDKPGTAPAVMLHPGHPLMLSVSDLILEQNANLLRQGAVLVDSSDEGTEPWLMFMLTHEVKSGDGQVISKRLQFVRVTPEGQATFAGWAPHLDLEPLAEEDTSLVADQLQDEWLKQNLEQQALALAASKLVPEHFKEVADRRIAHVDKTLQAVHDRLTKEIDFWTDRWMKLTEDKQAGKDVRLNLENARRTIGDLQGRLENRKKSLQSMRHVTSGTPVVLSGALVLPAGLLRSLRGGTSTPGDISHDPAARARIENLAMDAVTEIEESLGCRVDDSHQEGLLSIPGPWPAVATG